MHTMNWPQSVKGASHLDLYFELQQQAPEVGVSGLLPA
jgi:hypothetical protein